MAFVEASDATRLRLVSRDWRDLCSDSFLWREYFVKAYGGRALNWAAAQASEFEGWFDWLAGWRSADGWSRCLFVVVVGKLGVTIRGAGGGGARKSFANNREIFFLSSDSRHRGWRVRTPDNWRRAGRGRHSALPGSLPLHEEPRPGDQGMATGRWPRGWRVL